METLQMFEQLILDWIQMNLRCELLDVFFPVFTALCNHGECWILLAVLLCFEKKHRRAGVCLGGGLLLNLVVTNMALKPLIGRIRPFMVNTAVELLVEMPLEASFPSGHTACSFAAVAALKAAGNPLWKPALGIAILMGFSRLYLYVHWPTDILGGVVVGWCAGWLGATAVLWLMKRYEKYRAKEE